MLIVTGNVTSQAKAMFLNKDQSTPFFDLSRPVKTTLPTLQCVDEIGIFMSEAPSTVMALLSSMTKPLDGVILVKSSPIVLITLRPMTHKPILIPTPKRKN